MNVHVSCPAWLLSEQRQLTKLNIRDFYLLYFTIHQEDDAWLCTATIEMPCRSLTEIDNDSQILAVLQSDPRLYERLLSGDVKAKVASLKGNEQKESNVPIDDEERRLQVLKVSPEYGLPLSGNKQLSDLNSPQFNAFINSFRSVPDLSTGQT